MKKYILLLSALILLFTLSGCSEFIRGFRDGIGSGDDSAATQTIKSAESNLSLEVPGSWREYDLHEQASIQMAHLAREHYLIVMEELGIDFVDDFTLQDYAEIIRNNMVDIVDNADNPVITDATIGNNINAKQFELAGTVDGIKIKYYVTFAKTNDVFYQFVTWSLQSRYDDAKPVFDEILRSATF
jgi:hypothetical protein